ncbi:MAG: hypothetical protein ACTHM1_04505 [Solirubrobacteraceae bacterium]
MALRIEVDPERFEQATKENVDQLMGIIGQAKERGLIHHEFYAGEGAVMAVDEWPDEQSFLGFYEAAGPQIGELMANAGVSTQPQPTFWRLLDTPDKV